MLERKDIKHLRDDATTALRAGLEPLGDQLTTVSKKARRFAKRADSQAHDTPYHVALGFLAFGIIAGLLLPFGRRAR